MNFAVTLLLGLYAVLAVLLTTRHFGRMAGLSTAAICGASLAFFAMPPALSFVVEDPFDQGALLVYSMASLVLVHRAPRLGNGGVPSLAGSGWRRRREEPAGASLADAIEEALLRSAHAGVEVRVPENLTVSRSRSEVLSLAAAILESACSEIEPIRITAYGGRTPGQERIWIAIQHSGWPEAPRVVTIGRHVDTCVRLPAPGSNCAVTWFDNGFERVYQVSAPL